MDSEKNQKLFLDMPDPASGFQEYSVKSESGEVSGVSMPSFPPEQSEATTNAGFGLPDRFWDWLSADAVLKTQFEKMIETKVSERVDSKLGELKEVAAKEAHAEGFKKGLEEGRSMLKHAGDHLNDLCKEVLKEKESLLRDHEGRWAGAFSHVLKRFLVSKRELAIEGIQSWLVESLGAFEQNAKVNIYLSPGDYVRLSSPVGNPEAGQKWTIVRDESLKEGEVHCECDGGGIFFSSKEQMAKLEMWIDRFTSRGGDWTV